MNSAAIVQARLGSTRLPRKVLADISGKPALQRVIERARLIKGIDRVIAAIPASDSGILGPLLADIDCPYFCGSELDVLDRYYQTAKAYNLDVIVRITADCPLLDPEIGTQAVNRFYNSMADYASNTIPATYPDGMDVECFSFWALAKAHTYATQQADREHVTSYMYRRPSPYRLATLWNTKDESMYRMTLDTAEDLDWIRAIYKLIGRDMFGYKDTMDLLAKRPDLALIANRAYIE